MGQGVVEPTAAAALSDTEADERLARAGVPLYVSLLGLRLTSPIDIVKRVEEGLRFQALERFQENTQLSTSDLAEVVAIKPRTLHRRREEGRLAPDESDRLLRAARVFGRVLELFEGDREAATDWLTTLNAALGGVAPLQYARTNAGAHEVERLIGRIEHGVYS